MTPFIRLHEGDVIELKKPHPCGANSWEVTRLGIDIALVCQGCGHRVLIPRSRVEQRFKRFIKRAASEDGDGVAGT
jgi:hypothetical protein